MRHMTTVDRNIMIARRLRESEVVRNHRRGGIAVRSVDAIPMRPVRADGIEMHRELERTDDGAKREIQGDRARDQRERKRRERTSGRKGHRRITYYS